MKACGDFFHRGITESCSVITIITIITFKPLNHTIRKTLLLVYY